MQLPFDLHVPMQFVYLVMMVPLSAIWLFLFYKYPRYRRAFLIGAIAIGTVGHLSVLLMYRFDWWKPLSFMNNDFTFFEDFILAGANAGLVIITWPLLTGLDFKEKLSVNWNTVYQLVAWWLILLIFPYVLFLLGVHSFIAEMVVYSLFIFIVFMKRVDLFIPAIVSAFLVTLATIPFYIGIQLLNNNYVALHYHLDKLSGNTFLNVPIEDFVWYFGVNVLLAVFYHFIFESEFESKPLSFSRSYRSLKRLFNLKKVE